MGSSLRHAGSFVTACCLFIEALGLQSLVVARGFSLSSCGARAPGRMGSVVEALEISSCDVRA